MKTFFKESSRTIIIIGVLFGVVTLVSAWTAPTQAPPGGNVSAPVNVSGTEQLKSGALGISGVFKAYSDAIFSGKVGIGTAAPDYKLSVLGAPNTKIIAVYPNFSDGQYGAITAQFGPGDASGQSAIRFYRKGWGSDIRFNTWNTGGVDNGEVMTIANTGNVGIGTTNPSQKLDVAGYVKGQTGLCIGNDCKSTWPSGGAINPVEIKINYETGDKHVDLGKYNFCAITNINFHADSTRAQAKYDCWVYKNSDGMWKMKLVTGDIDERVCGVYCF